jgi:hypothetical protein
MYVVGLSSVASRKCNGRIPAKGDPGSVESCNKPFSVRCRSLLNDSPESSVDQVVVPQLQLSHERGPLVARHEECFAWMLARSIWAGTEAAGSSISSIVVMSSTMSTRCHL